MECSFCPYPLKTDKISKLSLDNVKNIIDQIDPGIERADSSEQNYIW